MRFSIFIVILTVAGLSLGDLLHRHRPRKFGIRSFFKSNRLSNELSEDAPKENSETEPKADIEAAVETVQAPVDETEFKEPPTAPTEFTEVVENIPEEEQLQENGKSFVETPTARIEGVIPKQGEFQVEELPDNTLYSEEIIYPDQAILIGESPDPIDGPYIEEVYFPKEDDLITNRSHQDQIPFDRIFRLPLRDQREGAIKPLNGRVQLKKRLLHKLVRILRFILIKINDLVSSIISTLTWFLS